MPTFDTPGPISVTVEVVLGDIQITASKRADTVVEVNPTDGANASDVEAAQRAQITYSRGKLLVKMPKPWGKSSDGSVAVRIELPEGSGVRSGSAWAAVQSEGRLGDCRIETVNGDIRLDETGALRLTAVSGAITVAHATGHAEIINVSGDVRVDKIDGTALIKNEYGDSSVGEITGALRMTGTNGNFSVDRAHTNVKARTAHGNVRIGEIARGSVVLTTAFGDVEIGIPQGTAAKLDVRTVAGQVRNSLNGVDGPAQSDEIIDLRAETFNGDIVIHRA